MKPVRLLAGARIELDEIVEYYDAESEGQGFRFAAQIEKLIRNIQRFPLSYVAVSQRIRCASTESFPYNLFYSVLSDEILVISIAHQRRRPRRWDDPSPH